MSFSMATHYFGSYSCGDHIRHKKKIAFDIKSSRLYLYRRHCIHQNFIWKHKPAIVYWAMERRLNHVPIFALIFETSLEIFPIFLSFP